VLAPDGQFLFGYGAGRIFEPHGITSITDRVWIARSDAHQGSCFSSDGALLSSLGDGTPALRAPLTTRQRWPYLAEAKSRRRRLGNKTKIHRFEQRADISQALVRSAIRQCAQEHIPLLVDRNDRVSCAIVKTIAVQILAARDNGSRAGRLSGTWIYSS